MFWESEKSLKVTLAENDRFRLNNPVILHKNTNITHTCLEERKMSQEYLFKLKHKQICNLFTQKTYKKGLLPFIFTICDLGEKIVLLL